MLIINIIKILNSNQKKSTDFTAKDEKQASNTLQDYCSSNQEFDLNELFLI